MPVKIQTLIDAEILANISDPLNKQNTPAKLRQVIGDISDTMFSGKTYEATLTIPTASVLTLNSIPLNIVAAPGAGKYIEVISASSILTYVSIVYVTNIVLGLWNTGAGTPLATNSSSLVSTASRISNFTFPTNISGTTTTQMLENTALQVKVSTGDPSLGNSGIVVKVLYRIVTI